MSFSENPPPGGFSLLDALTETYTSYEEFLSLISVELGYAVGASKGS